MDTEKITFDEILTMIHGSGGRVTVAKRTVAEVLVEADHHLTADEITHAVQQRAPDVGLSTIYRILEEFEGLHVVIHAHLGHTAAVYHLVGAVHGHLVCGICGETKEIPASAFDSLGRHLRTAYGFALDRHHVAVSGTCEVCRERDNESPNP